MLGGPQEPARHSVTGNGKRDGAKAERRKKDAASGVWQDDRRMQQKPGTRFLTVKDKGLFSRECPDGTYLCTGNPQRLGDGVPVSGQACRTCGTCGIGCAKNIRT